VVRRVIPAVAPEAGSIYKFVLSLFKTNDISCSLIVSIQIRQPVDRQMKSGRSRNIKFLRDNPLHIHQKSAGHTDRIPSRLRGSKEVTCRASPRTSRCACSRNGTCCVTILSAESRSCGSDNNSRELSTARKPTTCFRDGREWRVIK
jgi:hypothetical protein